MTFDIKQASLKLREEIDNYCINAYSEKFRTHLGISIIGGACLRKIWYSFRWCFSEDSTTPPKDKARKQRLFKRGHLEEARFIEYLRGIGCVVKCREYMSLFYHPESDTYFYDWAENVKDGHCEDVSNLDLHIQEAIEKGVHIPDESRQILISALGGHFGGSLDAEIILPERYGYSKPILAEFKTNGTGAGFTGLLKNGVKTQKPVHYIQACTYAGFKTHEYALYMNANKNDDDLHIEFFKVDEEMPERMLKRAKTIITAECAPVGISPNGSATDCKMCDARNICIGQASAEVNCRSCRYAKAVDNGEWFCTGYCSIIPKDKIIHGCANWEDISKFQPAILPI